MDFNKALKILGLTSSFTEEELRKTYRRLIAKYHPDKFENKSEKERKNAEEKAKEINVAKEYLEKYLKEKAETNAKTNQNNYQNNSEIIELVFRKEKLKTIINNMEIELNNFAKNINDNTVEDVKDKIMFIVKSTKDQIQLIQTLSAFKIIENSYYRRINLILEQFEKDYCKKHNIIIGNRKLERYSLKKLYQELEEIRKTYQLFYTILETEYEKYTSYAGFNTVYPAIIIIKKQTIDMFKNMLSSGKKDDNIINQIIDTFNKKVLEIFEVSYKNIKIINELKEKYKDTKDLEIRKLLMWAEKYVYDICAFNYYMTELEKHIKYEEEKSDRTLAKPGIKKSYERKDYNFNNKYTKYIKEEFITDNYKIQNNNNIIKKRRKI